MMAIQRAPWTRKRADEQQAAEYPVRVEQGEQVALENTFLVDGYTLKNIAEGNPEQKGRRKTADENARVPHLAPERVIDFSPELKRDAPQNQGKQDEHQGRVEG